LRCRRTMAISGIRAQGHTTRIQVVPVQWGGSHGRGRCGARCPTASTRERKAEREKEKQGWVADVWGPLGGDSKEW
jgi:hypothetical protein